MMADSVSWGGGVPWLVLLSTYCLRSGIWWTRISKVCGQTGTR